MRSVFVLLGCVMPLACAGKTIDIGPGSGDPTTSGSGGRGTSTGGATPPSEPPPVWPDLAGCTGASDPSIVGSWKGYIENEAAPWDTMLLSFHGTSATGGLCGTLRLGTGAAPPPPTDPDKGYPEGFTFGYPVPAVEGFTYTFLGGSFKEGRLRFDVGLFEPWRAWCALESPVAGYYNKGRYECVQDGPLELVSGPDGCFLRDPGNGATTDIDCNKVDLCEWVCACDASRCEASTVEKDSYDLHLDQGAAEGNVYRTSRPVGTLPGKVHFFRAE